jgi:hypothetical protein
VPLPGRRLHRRALRRAEDAVRPQRVRRRRHQSRVRVRCALYTGPHTTTLAW